MENSIEISQILKRFTRLKEKKVPKELNDYFQYVARTGDTIYHWSNLKYLFHVKLNQVIERFNKSSQRLNGKIPIYPNEQQFNYEAMKYSLLERLNRFTVAPFTVQRLCELLTAPYEHYSRIDKFMRAVEKTICISSSNKPGRMLTESEDASAHADDAAVEPEPKKAKLKSNDESEKTEETHAEAVAEEPIEIKPKVLKAEDDAIEEAKPLDATKETIELQKSKVEEPHDEDKEKSPNFKKPYNGDKDNKESKESPKPAKSNKVAADNDGIPAASTLKEELVDAVDHTKAEQQSKIIEKPELEGAKKQLKMEKPKLGGAEKVSKRKKVKTIKFKNAAPTAAVDSPASAYVYGYADADVSKLKITAETTKLQPELAAPKAVAASDIATDEMAKGEPIPMEVDVTSQKEIDQCTSSMMALTSTSTHK